MGKLLEMLWAGSIRQKMMRRSALILLFNPTIRVVLCVAAFVALLLAALAYKNFQPKMYESTARVWVQARIPAGPEGQSPQAGVYSPLLFFFNSPLTTASEILRSSIVYETALKLLQQESPQRHWPTLGELGGSIATEPVKDADVLVVKCWNKDPQVACRVLKAVLDAFIKVNLQQSAGAATESRQFLEKQLDAERQQWDKARTELRDFREAHLSTNPDDQAQAIYDHMTSVKARINDSKIAVQQLRKRINLLESQLGITVSDAVDLEKLSGDLVLKKLQENFADNEVKLIEARARHGDQSAITRHLNATLEKTEAAINDRIRLKLGKSDFNLGGEVVSSEQLKVLDELRQKHADEFLEGEKLSILNSMLPNLEAQLKGIPSEQLKFAELIRAEAEASDSLTAVQKQLNEARLIESVSAEATNIQIIDEPQVPTVPESGDIRKTRIKLFAVSIVPAAALFLALWWFDPFVSSAKQISRMLAMPVAGWLETLPTSSSLNEIPVLHNLRFALQSWFEPRLAKIVVLSPDQSDGKSTVAVGLAMSLAEGGLRVLLVDANLKSPVLHKLFNCPVSPGISDCSSDLPSGCAASLARPVAANVSLIPAGKALNSGRLLQGALLTDILDFAKEEADIVIFDTAALAEAEGALALVGADTYTLTVIRLDHTLRQSLRMLAGQLHDKLDSGRIVLTNASARDYVESLPNKSLEELSAEPTASW